MAGDVRAWVLAAAAWLAPRVPAPLAAVGLLPVGRRAGSRRRLERGSPRPSGAAPALLAVLGAAAALGPRGAAGSGGITDDERLLFSDGSWHRSQRKRIPFEAACYYTHEPELPYGCQYSASRSETWRAQAQRLEERTVLMDLYDTAAGDSWRANDNWGTDSDPCWDSWYGVTCDEHGHVIALELADNALVGALPTNLGLLKSLLKLDLSTTAPDYHGHPNIYVNRLRGKLPSLAGATRIEEIEVSGNELTGLPDDLYVVSPTLRVLSASHNLLTALPRYLRRFTKLHTLELGHNLINDVFPVDLGYLSNVRFVQLEYNFLRGTIPSAVVGMRRVRVFDISHNPDLAGELPKDIIVEWQDQEYLAILNTSITGYISTLCIDVPFCWRYMYDTHKDLTWATVIDVPDIVNLTVTLAQSGR